MVGCLVLFYWVFVAVDDIVVTILLLLMLLFLLLFSQDFFLLEILVINVAIFILASVSFTKNIETSRASKAQIALKM